MEVIHLQAPFDKEVVKTLRAGDSVLLSGHLIVARDAAHKAISEDLQKNKKPPLSLQNQILYYLGPSPAKPDEIIGAAGPTTSGRMDKYTPMMIQQGISGMIGKGYRSKEVVDCMIKNKVVYMVAIGGAGALISQCILEYEVLAYHKLGPESLARIKVKDFPVIVAIDCYGNNFYEIGQKPYKKI